MSDPNLTAAHLKIGELAKKTGKTVRALHLYEELGLLRPARSGGGFRLYGPDEEARVYWISKLQDMGFRLGQIQSLLDVVAKASHAPEAMSQVRREFERRLDATRGQLARLTQLEQDLRESLEYLDGCRSCPETEPAHRRCPECDRTHGPPRTQLVAGLTRLPAAESRSKEVLR